MYGKSTSMIAPIGFSQFNKNVSETTKTTTTTEKENITKKKKPIFWAIVVTILVILTSVAIPEIKYQSAKNHLAYVQRKGLHRFEDDLERCELAIKKFSSLGNYRQSEELLKECIYEKAMCLTSSFNPNLRPFLIHPLWIIFSFL